MLSGIFLPLRAATSASTRLGDVGEAPADDAARGEVAGQFQQARGARIDRVEAVAEPGHIALLLGEEAVEPGRHGLAQKGAAIDRGGDVAEEGQRLLAGAAMHVAQHVDRRRHGAVDADAAGRGHAGDGDRRRLRAVVDGGAERDAEQLGLRLGSAARRAASARSSPERRRGR